jgi:protein-disulfide isomerase
VVRDFPLEFHKNAFKAAEAANCAEEQGKFWDMQAKLFENQRALDVSQLPKYAAEIGLDTTKFQACLDSGKYAEKIKKEVEEGQKAGVTGTPAFFLGMTTPNDPKVKIVKTLKGAQPYAKFKEAIDSLLSK